jgi:hypothetical protein
MQGQMRHSKIETTMNIYVQHVPESQRRALEQMTAMVEERVTKAAHEPKPEKQSGKSEAVKAAPVKWWTSFGSTTVASGASAASAGRIGT